MSHSITFHCVYFEFSTVPKRETIQGSRSWKSSPVFSRCLVWFPRKNRKKLQVLMSHSITFHCVYFELSTVPKRETIDSFPNDKINLNGSIPRGGKGIFFACVVKLGKRWDPETLWFFTHENHATKSHLPKLISRAGRSDINNPEKVGVQTNGVL